MVNGPLEVDNPHNEYTFEPKRCGVALDKVAFGAVFGAQGRAWPHRQEEIKERERERRRGTKCKRGERTGSAGEFGLLVR